MIKILITGPGTFTTKSRDLPVEGQEYILENALDGSSAQNKATHALIQEYFKSGCYSDNANTWLELKEFLKRRIGEGFETFLYFDKDDVASGLQESKLYLDIPEHIRKSKNRTSFIKGKLKSWSEYTQKQRREFIDNLLAEMGTAQVQTPKFYEIIAGMEGNNDSVGKARSE